jgi:hypothetical protein
MNIPIKIDILSFMIFLEIINPPKMPNTTPVKVEAVEIYEASRYLTVEFCFSLRYDLMNN